MRFLNLATAIWTACIGVVVCMFLFLTLGSYSTTNPAPDWISWSMFVAFGIGVLAFLVMGISFLINLFKKKREGKNLFGINTGMYFMTGIVGLGVLFILIMNMSMKTGAELMSNQGSSSIASYSQRIFVPTPTPTPRVKKKLDGGYLFNLVNAYRRGKGLQEMTWWHKLCEYSTERSAEIQRDWSHGGYLEDSKNGELYGKYCPGCTRTGENLAKDYWTEEEILQAWINSPTHKANLDEAGWNIGCAMVIDNNFVSMEFGNKQP